MVVCIGIVIWKCRLVIIRNSVIVLNIMSLDMVDGFCLKKGGGVWFRVFSGMVGWVGGCWGGVENW